MNNLAFADIIEVSGKKKKLRQFIKDRSPVTIKWIFPILKPFSLLEIPEHTDDNQYHYSPHDKIAIS